MRISDWSSDVCSSDLLILIKHGGNWVTAYAHADALLVGRGQIAKRGDVIARAGQTGSVDVPQVQFAMREGRKQPDPPTLPPKRGRPSRSATGGTTRSRRSARHTRPHPGPGP